MAVEARRGCGYRKVGGLYIMGGKLGAPCCKLPVEMCVCPTCSMGVRLTRTWTWVNPRPWLRGECSQFASKRNKTKAGAPFGGLGCPAANPEALGEEVGLLNVGAAFYKTPEDFTREAAEQGVSRRVAALPKGFRVGETWVLLAHPRLREREVEQWHIIKMGEKEKQVAVRDSEADVNSYLQFHDRAGNELRVEERLKKEWVGGIFSIFRPTSVDKIVTETQARDEAEMEKLRKQGITPVAVPDNDPDHQGSVYGEDEADEAGDE